MESNWRWNVAAEGWTDSDIRLVARNLGPGYPWYIQRTGSLWPEQVLFLDHPTSGEWSWIGGPMPGWSFTTLWQAGLLEGDHTQA